MAINIRFDLAGNPEPPTIILATRNGSILGQLDYDEESIELIDKLNDASEFTFTIHKPDAMRQLEGSSKVRNFLKSSDKYLLKDSSKLYLLAKNNSSIFDGSALNLWDKVVDFKLAYCVEWDTWFEMTVELDEDTETIKTVFCTQLGPAELSQLMLYNIEINTEDDIAREDYKITVLWDADKPEGSLLHRLLNDKAPHYSVVHVDPTIAKIQRTFSFDGTSIYDAFQEISEEIGCLFVFPSNLGDDGNIQRTIAVYDLETNCSDCGHRGEFTGVCPECGSINLIEGYGDDTTIFITSDELADDIQLSTDTDSVKNCFKLEAGDDLMTATIRNCNPNGTDYLWYISDSVKEDMSSELVKRLNKYNVDYEYYQNKYKINLDSNTLVAYNTLVEKYQEYNKELATIETPIIGYPSLMQAYYNTIDLELYLESSLMPPIDTSETDIDREAGKLISGNFPTISVESTQYISDATADSLVLAMAKIIVDSRYRVKINKSSFDKNGLVWFGNFVVSSYSDEDKTATSSYVSVNIAEDYASFVQQKIEKMLNKEEPDDYSIVGLFEKDVVVNEILDASGAGTGKFAYTGEFADELKRYSLNCLTSFYNACQSCIDILIDQGIGSESTWSKQEQNLYDDLYVPYLSKLRAIEFEMQVRQEELDLITGVYSINDELNEELVTYGLQNYIEDAQNYIHDKLNFEKYLDSDLWLEFCSFRREDKYSNSNYISDGLNNVELFDKALDFIEVAEKEIYKSAELQHSISSTLKNLLAIKKFKPLVDNFKVGNWLRILVDGVIYKLRLIEYSIDYGDFDNISVEFSDVVKLNSTVKSIQGVIEQASSIATSYDSVQKQAEQGRESNNILSGWSQKGMDVTNTKLIQGATNQTQVWDEHGMLFRKYDESINDYDDRQLKIVNSTMAITNDNWKTVKTAVGEYYYFHPKTNKLTKAYGINGEVLVGKLILGEELGIYNESNNLTFDNNGFKIGNGKNTFQVNPNDDVLLSIYKGDSNSAENRVFYVDQDGQLYIRGNGSGIDITNNELIVGLVTGKGSTKINGGAIAANTITSTQIASGTITANEIASNTITANEIASDAITSDKIAAGAITADHLAADTITAGTISADNIIGGSITTENGVMLGAGCVEGTLTKAYISADRITAGTISSAYISADRITSGTLNANNITLGSSLGGFAVAEGETKTTQDGVTITETTWGAKVYGSNPDTHYLIVTNAGVRLQSNNTDFYVSNNHIGASRTIEVSSDRRLKTDISYDIEKYRPFLRNLKPSMFHYIKEPNTPMVCGLVAQDVEEALIQSGLTRSDFDGLSGGGLNKETGETTTYSVAYEQFIPLLIDAVQDLYEKLENKE